MGRNLAGGSCTSANAGILPPIVTLVFYVLYEKECKIHTWITNGDISPLTFAHQIVHIKNVNYPNNADEKQRQ